MTPMLIVLHGVKRSGKDTTAQAIHAWAVGRSLTVRSRGFADKAKWAFARQFFPTIPMEDAIKWVDYYKESSRDILAPGFRNTNGTAFVRFRNAIAQFATEGGREIYGEDFWVDQLLPTSYGRTDWYSEFLVPRGSSDILTHPADICIVTDARFPNEIDRAEYLTDHVWKIRRPEAEEAVVAEAERQNRKVHASELGIPDYRFDLVIHNDGTLDELNDIVYRTMDTRWEGHVQRRNS